MDNTNIRCYLNLAHETDFIASNKDEITEYFNDRGIVDFKIIKTRVDSGIELFDSGYVESLFVEEVLEGLLNKLRLYQAEIIKITSEIDFSVKRVEVVINIYNEEMPSIFLNNSIIEFLNLNGFDIEFDMYCFS